MAQYSSVLSQLLSHIPRETFNAVVTRHEGNKGVRRFTCWKQLAALFYAQLTGQHSLRDLETAVNANLHKLGHVGLEAVRRFTLADANARRPSEIFQELFSFLYRRCLDSTVVDLCLKVFDWAKFRKRKGAVKLHLLLDHEGHIPSFCVITVPSNDNLPTRSDPGSEAGGVRRRTKRFLSENATSSDRRNWRDPGLSVDVPGFRVGGPDAVGVGLPDHRRHTRPLPPAG